MHMIIMLHRRGTGSHLQLGVLCNVNLDPISLGTHTYLGRAGGKLLYYNHGSLTIWSWSLYHLLRTHSFVKHYFRGIIQ